jgi:hypothetical protein
VAAIPASLDPALERTRDRFDELRWHLREGLPDSAEAERLAEQIDVILAEPQSFTAPITSARTWVPPKAVVAAIDRLGRSGLLPITERELDRDDKLGRLARLVQFYLDTLDDERTS